MPPDSPVFALLLLILALTLVAEARGELLETCKDRGRLRGDERAEPRGDGRNAGGEINESGGDPKTSLVGVVAA